MMSDKGYTFIELIIAMAVMVMLALAGMASYAKFNQKQRVLAAAEAVALELEGAKKRALSGEITECLVNQELTGYRVVLSVSSNDLTIYAICDGSDELVATKSIDGASLDGDDSVQFTLDGRAAAATNIQLESGSSQACVSVSLSGAVEVNPGECP